MGVITDLSSTFNQQQFLSSRILDPIGGIVQYDKQSPGYNIEETCNFITSFDDGYQSLVGFNDRYNRKTTSASFSRTQETQRTGNIFVLFVQWRILNLCRRTAVFNLM